MATGSRARKVTNGISNKKHWKKCIFNDDGLLTLLKYINTHLEDFRNNRWKAYKACAEMMPQDPRSKERYTERHLNSKVSHLLLENMKREFEVKDNRGRLFFTYGSQVLDLQVGFWYNKANGSVLSAQLESSLPTGISSPRETQRESAERHREQKRCPPADAVNTITNTNPLRIAIDQHSMGEARILRPYDLWEIGFDGGPDRFSSLSKDWTDNGLRNAMRELLGGVNNMVIACSCTNTPGPDYQNLDKQNSALVRLYKKVLGDDDDKRPFGEIIADKAIKAMAREDWLKSLIAAAVTMQVLQVDVPAVCYEQNTFCKALDTVLSLDPSQLYDPSDSKLSALTLDDSHHRHGHLQTAVVP